jgi:hypothetical protein
VDGIQTRDAQDEKEGAGHCQSGGPMTEQRIREQRLELLKDAGWRALLTIFCGDLLRDRGEVWNCIDLERRSIQIEKLLYSYGVLSGGEKRLVDIALSFFNRDHKVNLYSATSGLDDENSRLVVDALETFLDVGAFRHEMEIREVLLAKPVRKI